MTKPLASGRLFGPGLPGAGAVVSAHWRGHSLVVMAGEVEHGQVAASALSTVAAGFNSSQRQLTWQSPEGSFALHLDPGAAQILAAQGPPSWGQGLHLADARMRRVERHFRGAWAVLALLFALPVLLLAALVYKADGVADWVVDKVPVSHEAKLGDLVLVQTRLRHRLEGQGPAAEAVREIGQRLVQGSALSYRWYVSDDPTVNAFAAPGGVVVVNRGLIRAADSAEELAGVLAHEVAHAELRHGTKAMVKGLGLQALGALVLGDWAGSLAGEAATQLVNMKFSREAEREADAEGLKRLVHAGISPQGMLRFFGKLGKEQAALPAVLSTHPLPEDRLAALRDQVAGMNTGHFKPLPLDWAKLRGSLGAP